jgi:hypothetical protein
MLQSPVIPYQRFDSKPPILIYNTPLPTTLTSRCVLQSEIMRQEDEASKHQRVKIAENKHKDSHIQEHFKANHLQALLSRGPSYSSLPAFISTARFASTSRMVSPNPFLCLAFSAVRRSFIRHDQCAVLPRAGRTVLATIAFFTIMLMFMNGPI